MQITDLALNIELRDGIWFSKDSTEISYPSDGNEICDAIEDDSFWFQHRNNCISTLLNLHDPGGIMLDVGGGNGIVTKKLNQDGFDTFLLEPGMDGIVSARSKGIDKLICSTLEDAGFEKNSIPAMGIFDVLEHIDDDVSFLYELAAKLRVGGKLYISVPAYKFLWSGDDDRAGHFRRYTTGELKNKLAQVGFKTLYGGYMFSILPAPILMFRTFPTWIGRYSDDELLKKRKKEHTGKDFTLLNKIWNWEINSIKSGRTLPFGGSCLFAAEKL